MKQIKWVKNTMPKTDDANLSVMALEEVEKARAFHKTIPGYENTSCTSDSHGRPPWPERCLCKR